jgi:hypothetical protein
VNARSFIVMAVTLAASAAVGRGDTFWEGNVDSNWANPANWAGSVLPSTAGSGNAIVNNVNGTLPVVTTAGNTTNNELFIAPNAGLTVAAGGSLQTVSLVTGNWGAHPPVLVNGTVNVLGFLNIGANGGFDGSVIVDAGLIRASALSINTLPENAKLILKNGGVFNTTLSQLNNVNYWLGSGNIVPGPGEILNVDTTSTAGRLIITSVAEVPEPSTLLIVSAVGIAGLGVARRRQANS